MEVQKQATDWESLPLMLSVEDLMGVLGVGRNKAYETIHIKGFPVLWFGGIAKIPRDALRKWIEKRAKDLMEQAG